MKCGPLLHRWERLPLTYPSNSAGRLDIGGCAAFAKMTSWAFSIGESL